MPTYQYACPDCGAEFEKVQKFADKPIKKCPTCSKNKVHRVVGRIAVSFKGTGFYINDSKSSSSTSTSTKPKDSKETAEKSETAATPDAGAKDSKDTVKAEPAAAPAESGSESTPSESKKKSKAKKD